MGKKKHEEVEEEEVAPFWMISFSDLMTLLLSFFIILFSISTIETKKMEELMQAMGDRYVRGGTDRSGKKDIHSDPSLPLVKHLTAIKEANESLALELQKRKSETNLTIIPFKLESTDLDDEDKKKLSKLAENLNGLPYPIVVRGHAALSEKSRNTVDDLAYERAWNVREYLLTLGLNPQRFSLSIIGPYEPLDSLLLSPSFGNANTYVEVILEEDK